MKFSNTQNYGHTYFMYYTVHLCIYYTTIAVSRPLIHGNAFVLRLNSDAYCFDIAAVVLLQLLQCTRGWYRKEALSSDI